MLENKPPDLNKNSKPEMWGKLLDFGLEFALMIALPLLGFIYLGRWLDTRYEQKFFVVIGILLALMLSSYMIYKKIKSLKDLLK